MRLRPLLLCLAAACGGHGSSIPDAGGDAPRPPPPPPREGPASLTITRDGLPVPDVDVVFQGETSLVLATVKTNTAGTATVVIRGSVFVTAIDPFGPPAVGQPHDLRTFAGVQPNDALELVQDLRDITVTINAPIDPGATTYALRTSCGSGTLAANGAAPTGQVTLRRCNGFADILLETNNAAGTAARFLFMPNAAVADTGTIQLTGSYQPPTLVRVDYAGVFDFDLVHGRIALASPRGPLTDRAFDVAITQGFGSVQVRLPVVSNARHIISSRPVPRSPAVIGTPGLIDWDSAFSNPTVDLFEATVPGFIEPPDFVPPNSVHWIEEVPTFVTFESSPPPFEQRPDFAIIELLVSRPSPAQTWRWSVAAPVSGAFAMLPTLPGPNFNIAPSDTVEVRALTTLKVPDAFGPAARAHALDDPRPEAFVTATLGGRIAYHELRAP